MNKQPSAANAKCLSWLQKNPGIYLYSLVKKNTDTWNFFIYLILGTANAKHLTSNDGFFQHKGKYACASLG